MKTAEWECTACQATNRRLVADDATRAQDGCVTCRTPHGIEENERPVRWTAFPLRSPRVPRPGGSAVR